jgi:hypothetical protein
MSWMRIGQNCDYDKKNIGNTAIPYRITKSWLYPWHFRGDDFNLINRNLGSIASLIVTTINQGYRDMNYGINWEVYTPYELWYQLRGIYSIWTMVSTERYILHMNYGINWQVYTPYELWYQLRGIYSIWTMVSTERYVLHMNYGINWEVCTPYELWYQLRGIYSIWTMVSTERYILHMQVLLDCCYM